MENEINKFAALVLYRMMNFHIESGNLLEGICKASKLNEEQCDRIIDVFDKIVKNLFHGENNSDDKDG